MHLAKSVETSESVYATLLHLCSTQNMELQVHRTSLWQLQGQVVYNLTRVHREGIASFRDVAADSHISPWNGRSRHFALPPGQIAVIQKTVSGRKPDSPKMHHASLTFTPPSWLSSVSIRWDLDVRTVVGGLPRLSLSLSPVHYNPSPELKAATINFDVVELQRLFHEGIARPTDQVMLRRPVSLLEVSCPPSFHKLKFKS